MKKKLLSALLCVAMVASLVVGCGAKEEAPAAEAPAATEEAAEEVAEEAVEEATEEIEETVEDKPTIDPVSMLTQNISFQPSILDVFEF